MKKVQQEWYTVRDHREHGLGRLLGGHGACSIAFVLPTDLSIEKIEREHNNNVFATGSTVMRDEVFQAWQVGWLPAGGPASDRVESGRIQEGVCPLMVDIEEDWLCW